ncbi:hypothetical protein [Reyranella sp.]|jgi:hypothetical protein|uniref:hypothetical protein n=1 Tax=Reyranella sp. TaxID=1929291 RepID=UPI002F935D7E
MPLEDWDAFQDSHHRPHLVIVDFPKQSDSKARKHGLALLERLAKELRLGGPYAMSSDRRDIRVVFENDIDAKRFGDALQAKARGKEAAWASTAHCSLDRSAKHRIATSLRAAHLKLGKRPAND